MKNKNAGYQQIKRQLYLYIMIAVGAAAAFVMLLRQLMRGFAGDWIVSLLQSGFLLREREALAIYHYVVRNNMELITGIAVAVCCFILCRLVLIKFMRYFDEMNALQQELEIREQEAKLAEQKKNDLVMYLAHDIKTPLTSVMGYLSLLQEAPDMPPEQKAKYVQITLEKAYRLEQLIDEFFEITRYNFQSILLVKQNIDLHYMLVQLTEEFYPQLAAQGKQASIHAAEDLSIYGDPDKLARVFNNILKNALAYSPDNSVIEIMAQILGAKVSITFRNAGSIPQDKLTTIFEKFHRLDAARSSATGGAGLGLAIAKEIVALHGGEIFAQSEGGYTAFTVELPIMAEQP